MRSRTEQRGRFIFDFSRSLARWAHYSALLASMHHIPLCVCVCVCTLSQRHSAYFQSETNLYDGEPLRPTICGVGLSYLGDEHIYVYIYAWCHPRSPVACAYVCIVVVEVGEVGTADLIVESILLSWWPELVVILGFIEWILTRRWALNGYFEKEESILILLSK